MLSEFQSRYIYVEYFWHSPAYGICSGNEVGNSGSLHGLVLPTCMVSSPTQMGNLDELVNPSLRPLLDVEQS